MVDDVLGVKEQLLVGLELFEREDSLLIECKLLWSQVHQGLRILLIFTPICLFLCLDYGIGSITAESSIDDEVVAIVVLESTVVERCLAEAEAILNSPSDHLAVVHFLQVDGAALVLHGFNKAYSHLEASLQGQIPTLLDVIALNQLLNVLVGNITVGFSLGQTGGLLEWYE